MAKSENIQGTFFEEDYLIRSLGKICQVPDIALTELIANAWDAGASNVSVTIPDVCGEPIIVEDDGCGLTEEEFKRRWMTLGYDRQKHQGMYAEYPLASTHNTQRRAFGRNGVGRHSMLCFASEYDVISQKQGSKKLFRVAAHGGENPFVLNKIEKLKNTKKQGTRLRAIAERNIPKVDKIREVLSARFLHDPNFTVSVNGLTVNLSEHKGLIDEVERITEDGIKLKLVVIDSSKTARTMYQHGIAFWVGGRLVGEPSWIIGKQSLADGRTWFAKRHTIIVQSDDLFDYVEPDWTGFKENPVVKNVESLVIVYIDDLLKRLYAEKSGEVKENVLLQQKIEYDKLRPLARYEVEEFVDEMMRIQPTAQQEFMEVAVSAMIRIEQSRSGVSLLTKLSQLTDEDIEGLNRLLEQWTVKDALAVLDEIDKRLLVLEAINRFSRDPKVDELKTLHPLVTQARWIFGPEYDSLLYSSNVSIVNAVEKVFGQKVERSAFLNYRKRPDILVLNNSSVHIVGSDECDSITELVTMKHVLLIELKKGGYKVGRDEIHQAEEYCDDLLNCGLLDGTPLIKAYVVGHEMDAKTSSSRTIGQDPIKARIELCTFGQLTRTAEKRLFRLKTELNDRYSEMGDSELKRRALTTSQQIDMSYRSQ